MIAIVTCDEEADRAVRLIRGAVRPVAATQHGFAGCCDQTSASVYTLASGTVVLKRANPENATEGANSTPAQLSRRWIVFMGVPSVALRSPLPSRTPQEEKATTPLPGLDVPLWPSIWTAPSDGTACDTCGQAIKTRDTAYEIVAAGHDMCLDRACYQRLIAAVEPNSPPNAGTRPGI